MATTITLLSCLTLIAAVAVGLPASISNLRAARRRNACLDALAGLVDQPSGELVDVDTAVTVIAAATRPV